MDVGYGDSWTNPKMNLNIMEALDDFEPQTRARSNTWPLPRPKSDVEPGDEAGNKCARLPVPTPATVVPIKRNSSSRNAWGNLSYANLITQAITSSLDNRLTLSQIYEWMVQNVPYFKDKGVSKSSAGWKNSIRHNLSLHNRFMRVQNEVTGKSSWWMINPDAKPGKYVRRRAASMQTSKFEKRKDRVKKKVEALRNGMAAATPSSSSVSESLDLFSDLPIHSGGGFVGVEPDWSSPLQFPNSNCSTEMSGNYSPGTLAGNLEQGMKLQQQPDAYMGYMNGQGSQQPPSPYAAPYKTYNSYRDLNAISGCMNVQCKVERMSPSYPTSEPSPDTLNAQYIMNTNGNMMQSPPLTPQTIQGIPLTMLGQLMGALNNSTLQDDLNLNIESIQGSFDCNVDEIIKHELSMDGSLDFNFSDSHQNMQQQQELVVTNPPSGAPPAYSASVMTPSRVH